MAERKEGANAPMNILKAAPDIQAGHLLTPEKRTELLFQRNHDVLAEQLRGFWVVNAMNPKDIRRMLILGIDSYPREENQNKYKKLIDLEPGAAVIHPVFGYNQLYITAADRGDHNPSGIGGLLHITAGMVLDPSTGLYFPEDKKSALVETLGLQKDDMYFLNFADPSRPVLFLGNKTTSTEEQLSIVPEEPLMSTEQGSIIQDQLTQEEARDILGSFYM